MKNQIIANPQLHFLQNCSELEKEILQLYWKLDNDIFMNSPAFIKNIFNISQSELTKMVSNHSLLIFYLFCGHCTSYEKHTCKSQSCFNEILQKFRSRYRNANKCENCREIEKEKIHLEKVKKQKQLIEKMNIAIEEKKME